MTIMSDAIRSAQKEQRAKTGAKLGAYQYKDHWLECDSSSGNYYAHWFDIGTKQRKKFSLQTMYFDEAKRRLTAFVDHGACSFQPELTSGKAPPQPPKQRIPATQKEGEKTMPDDSDIKDLSTPELEAMCTRNAQNQLRYLDGDVPITLFMKDSQYMVRYIDGKTATGKPFPRVSRIRTKDKKRALKRMIMVARQASLDDRKALIKSFEWTKGKPGRKPARVEKKERVAKAKVKRAPFSNVTNNGNGVDQDALDNADAKSVRELVIDCRSELNGIKLTLGLMGNIEDRLKLIMQRLNEGQRQLEQLKETAQLFE